MGKRVGAGTIAAASTKIERHIIVVDGMENVEEVVSDSRRDGQIGRHFPFVLSVTPILRLSLPDEWKHCGVRSCSDLVVQKVCGGSISQRPALGRTLIQQHPPDFKSEFQRVLAF